MQAAFSGSVACHQRLPDALRLTQARNSCPLAAEFRGSQRIAFKAARSGIGAPPFSCRTYVVCICSCLSQHCNSNCSASIRNLTRVAGMIMLHRVLCVLILCCVTLDDRCYLTQPSECGKLGDMRIVDLEGKLAVGFQSLCVRCNMLGRTRMRSLQFLRRCERTIYRVKG